MAVCAVVGLLSGCFSEPNTAGGAGTELSSSSSTGSGTQVSSSTTTAAETSSGSTTAAETRSGSTAGTSTGSGSSSGIPGDTSASETTTAGVLECDQGFQTPEVLNLEVNGRQEVSFSAQIGYTEVHLFVEQSGGGGNPATAEFPLSQNQGGGQGGSTWAFSVKWPVSTDFQPGEAIVRFTGMDANAEFDATCGVLLE